MARLRWLNDCGLEERILNARGFLGIAFLSGNSVPCDHFRHEFEALADLLGNRIGLFAVSADENPTIAKDIGVQAFPTMLVFKDGDEVARYEGPYSREALSERLAGLIERGRKTK